MVADKHSEAVSIDATYHLFERRERKERKEFYRQTSHQLTALRAGLMPG